MDFPEYEFDFLSDLHLLGFDLDDLQMNPRAIDFGDGDDGRRVRSREEVVEGVRYDLADSIRDWLLCTSAAADRLRCVDLGCRRILTQKQLCW